MTINYFKRINDVTVDKLISIDEYITLVKSNPNKDEIEIARFSGKGDSLYKEVKQQQPYVTFNFLIDGKRSDKNIIKSTGLMYFDIDIANNTDFNINDLDFNKIFLCHHSFGGDGYTIIVKVEGVNNNNFESTYIDIVNQLGISSYYDNGAKKKTQPTFISYDPNIYINNNSFSFNSTEPNKNELQKTVKHLPNKASNTISLVDYSFLKKKVESKSVNILERNGEYVEYNKTDATDYIQTGEEYVVFTEKKEVTEIYLPMFKSIEKGRRSTTLYSIGINFLGLNSQVSKEELIEYIYCVNQKICSPALSFKDVLVMSESILTKAETEGISLITNKERRIVFRKGTKLTRKEKNQIIGKEVSKIRRDATQNKIKQCIDNWDTVEKITSKLVAIQIGMSNETVQRYWKDFKEEVKVKNNLIKQIK